MPCVYRDQEGRHKAQPLQFGLFQQPLKRGVIGERLKPVEGGDDYSTHKLEDSLMGGTQGIR